MQPLSRVKSEALVKWGDPNTMMLRQIARSSVDEDGHYSFAVPQ